MSSSLLSPRFLPDHWQAVVEGANSVGRTPNRSDWKIARDIFVGPTPEIARERARITMGRNYNVHQRPSRAGTFQMQIVKHDSSIADDAVDVEYLMERLWIVGDPQQCADKIRALYESVGGFGTLLCVTADSDDPAWDHESLRLLAEEVAPRIADLH
jgi:alkanesulfonate monooxygenase SsuD/methylene tetrahydromethanopterin reductase-like flavin-dependent oxidoreductase (luciferase family)